MSSLGLSEMMNHHFFLPPTPPSPPNRPMFGTRADVSASSHTPISAWIRTNRYCLKTCLTRAIRMPHCSIRDSLRRSKACRCCDNPRPRPSCIVLTRPYRNWACGIASFERNVLHIASLECSLIRHCRSRGLIWWIDCDDSSPPPLPPHPQLWRVKRDLGRNMGHGRNCSLLVTMTRHLPTPLQEEWCRAIRVPYGKASLVAAATSANILEMIRRRNQLTSGTIARSL